MYYDVSVNSSNNATMLVCGQKASACTYIELAELSYCHLKKCALNIDNNMIVMAAQSIVNLMTFGRSDF